MRSIALPEPVAAFMAAGTDRATSVPDAALLALCERHAEIACLIDCMNAKDSTHTEEELDSAADEFASLADRIGAMRAMTFGGLQAKARVAQDMLRHYVPRHPLEPHERAVVAFALDVQRAPLPTTMTLPEPTAEDAEVTRLAQAVVEAHVAHEVAVMAGAGSFEAEAEHAPEVAERFEALEERAEALAAMPVLGLAGIVAKARAALAMLPKGPEGEVEAGDNAHLLAYGALEDLVRLMGEGA
jgi:hypothetical protein